jgi:hypothetical protein
MEDITKATDACETENTCLKKRAKSKKKMNECSERYYITGDRVGLAFKYIT